MRRILIDTSHGPQFIDAYVHGKFAVNRLPSHSEMVKPEEALWSITHVATGLQFKRIWGRAAARRYARMLDAAIEADITAEDYKNKTPAWEAFGKALSAIVKRD